MVLVGLGFLTGSDVKDDCVSFAGGVFLESPELFRALDQPFSVERLSFSFSKSPSRLLRPDLLLLVAGDPVLVLGRRHFLEPVKSPKASIKLSVSCLHVVSWAEPIPVFRFFVLLEGQSFRGPFQFDIFIIERGLLVFADCSVGIA